MQLSEQLLEVALVVQAVLDRGPITPTDEERHDLEAIHQQIFAGSMAQPARLVGPTGEEIVLPPSLFRALQAAVDALSRGEAVTIAPIHKELTTQEAADLLNVSRQYLVRLLDEGRIPYAKTGTHRRVRFGDLMAYKEQRDTKRRRGLDELTRLSQELGLYE